MRWFPLALPSAILPPVGWLAQFGSVAIRSIQVAVSLSSQLYIYYYNNHRTKTGLLLNETNSSEGIKSLGCTIPGLKNTQKHISFRGHHITYVVTPTEWKLNSLSGSSTIDCILNRVLCSARMPNKRHTKKTNIERAVGWSAVQKDIRNVNYSKIQRKEKQMDWSVELQLPFSNRYIQF